MAADADLAALARALAEVGRAVRAAIATRRPSEDGVVLRTEGGDDVFGADQRAHDAVRRGLAELGARWPGRAVVEGSDEALPVGDASGPWRYLVDPLDGTRPWLAGKRSAWALFGAGRDAASLEELEVGAAVELPTSRSTAAMVAWAVSNGAAESWDEDLTDGRPPIPVRLCPYAGKDLARSYVTVARFSPGTKGAIGTWEDRLLGDVETYEDPYLCSGGQLMGLAMGSDAAVLDPRPLFGAALSAHPYDLASIVVARSAGVIVESLPTGPLDGPLDPNVPVAWAGYANDDVRTEIQSRLEWAPLP